MAIEHSRLAAITALVLCAAGLAAGGPAAASLPRDLRADQFEESQYAVLRDTFADRAQARPGEEFTLAVRLTPFDNGTVKFHTYGSEPSEDGSYIPTALTMDAAEGVTWSKPVFPPGIKHDTQMWLPEQAVITVSGKLGDNAQPGKRTFTGKLVVSACTEEMCLAPSEIPLTWELEVVAKDYSGTIAVLSSDELLKPVKVDMGRYMLPQREEAAPPRIPTLGGTIKWDQLKVQTMGEKAKSIWLVLGLALLGGLILNIMPCVLPVVSIKVISLARQMEEEPRTVVGHAVCFSSGIIAAFLALAVVVAIIQAGGMQLGWGFQFQNPAFLIVMMSIIFIFGMSLAGVFTIKPPRVLAETGERLAEKEGLGGSFFKGILATVLGTPCVGPFLGPALGYAFTRSTREILLIFLAVGLGMAFPYMLLIVNPHFLHMGRRERGEFSRRIMATKGWLVDFERVMAFVLFATVVYLLYILEGVAGGKVVVWTLAFLVALAFACWLWGRLTTLGWRGVAIAAAASVLILGAAGWVSYREAHLAVAVVSKTQLAWEPFSVSSLEQYAGQGRTVLVDFTADWCPNCKYNEATALNTNATKKLIEELNVATLKADWTVRDKDIGWALRQLGFASVPLTAIFPAGDPNRPILLDGVYTAARLHDALRAAAKD